MNCKIIPEIKKVELNQGNIYIKNFYIDSAFKQYMPIVHEIFNETVVNSRKQYPITYHQKGDIKAEAYEIEIVKDRITISASSESGFLYGVITIVELSKLNDGILDCCYIYDEPQKALRAVSDDISRGQISTFDNFKSIVKRLSKFKINTYFPYIEDVFAFKSEPEIGKFSDPVKPSEWKELCEYAKKFNVSVRPIFNTLGHWNKMGCLNKYKDMMIKVPDKTVCDSVNVLNPENSSVRPMLSRLLDEIVDAFGKGIVHVGGDEPVHLMETFGKEKAAKLYIDHYNWLSEELKKRGCSMTMYADVFSKIWGDYSIGVNRIKEISSDTNFVFWQYEPEADYSDLDEMLNMGVNVYISPAIWSWCRLAPDIKKCWDNTIKLMKTANGRSKGIIMSSWCDDGADNLRELNWAGYAVSGLYGWNDSTSLTFDDFMESFHKQFYCLKHFDVKRLYKLYEYDNELNSPDAFAVRNELFKDARKPVNEVMKSAAPIILEEYKSLKEYLSNHKPKYNKDSYNALIFSADREIFIIKKLITLTTGKYKTREEAMGYIKSIENLVADVATLRKKHKMLWFDSNRKSEWEFLESKYIDLEESFKSLLRYCKNSTRFLDNKFMI